MTKVRRIVEAILADIASGKLRGGDRVYSERQLTDRFAVSLGTAQSALRDLQHLGVLVREHGRGTFVRSASSMVSDARFIRFKDRDGNILPLDAHVTSIRRLKKGAHQREFFGPSTERCVRIIRRINVGNLFEVSSEFFLLESDFERLLSPEGAGAGVKGNIRENLAGILALPTLHVEQSVSLGGLSPRRRRSLSIPGSLEGFRMELRAYTIGDRPLYLQLVAGLDFGGTTLVIER